MRNRLLILSAFGAFSLVADGLQVAILGRDTIVGGQLTLVAWCSTLIRGRSLVNAQPCAGVRTGKKRMVVGCLIRVCAGGRNGNGLQQRSDRTCKIDVHPGMAS